MVDIKGELQPQPTPQHPIPDRRLPDNFRSGIVFSELKLDDPTVSSLYVENVSSKHLIAEHIRRAIIENKKREQRGDPTRRQWICVSGYLHGMDKLAEQLGDGTKTRYRNWGAEEFAKRINEALILDQRKTHVDKIILPLRRERKDRNEILLCCPGWS